MVAGDVLNVLWLNIFTRGWWLPFSPLPWYRSQELSFTDCRGLNQVQVDLNFIFGTSDHHNHASSDLISWEQKITHFSGKGLRLICCNDSKKFMKTVLHNMFPAVVWFLWYIDFFYAVDSLHSLYPDLLRRLDDSSDEIRVATAAALLAFIRCSTIFVLSK